MSIHPKHRIRKYDSHKNEKYLKWIRKRNCLVCGTSPCDAHHVEHNRSMDQYSVPLCRPCHREYHDIEHEAFEEKHGIKFEWEIIELLSEFINEKGASK